MSSKERTSSGRGPSIAQPVVRGRGKHEKNTPGVHFEATHEKASYFVIKARVGRIEGIKVKGGSDNYRADNSLIVDRIIDVSNRRVGEFVTREQAQRIAKSAVDSAIKTLSEKVLLRTGTREPVEDLAVSARMFGAPPGEKVEREAAELVVGRIAEDASDIFADKQEALRYLLRSDFDGRGNSAADLVEVGRATAVIARLEQLRFGPEG